MTRATLSSALAFVSGAVFGIGLGLGGMTKPAKVIGFLDFGGRWDASLLFVMAGAVSVHFVAYRLIRGRAAPLFAGRFELPTRRDLDGKLLLGASLFGVGWGLGGYCPGPAVVALGAGAAGAVVFVAALLVGMLIAAKLEHGARAALPEPTDDHYRAELRP